MGQLKDICTINEFLEDISITYDGYTEWEDGSCTLMISNLEEDTALLMKEIGLKNLGYNLFHSENNEIKVNEKLQYIEPFFTKKEESKWRDIISKILKYERRCSSEGIECPFEPSILQIQIATKWTGNITKNLPEFKDFVTDLNNFVIESLKTNIAESHTKNDFWRTMLAMRHGYSHDTTKWRARNKMEIAQNQREFFQDAVGKEQPNTPVGFIACQFKLLEMCSYFLDSLFGER